MKLFRVGRLSLVVFLISLDSFSLADERGDLPVVKNLKPLFEPAERRAAFGRPVSGFNCPSPLAHVRDLQFRGFYFPGTNSSEVDAKAMEAYNDATRPITDYENAITEMSDSYLRSKPPKPEIAQCVLHWLHTWASADAMLGRASEQGGFVRKWGLVPVAASYLKIRQDETLDKTKKKVTEAWISRWAKVVRTDYSTNTRKTSRQNNHLYWAALAVNMAAVVLNDRELFDWGVERYRFALTQIRDDGTLPLEVARGSKALHYHLFSIPPLVLVAETSLRNGLDLYGERNGAFHKLIRLTVAGLDNPSYFERLTGKKQSWVGKLSGGMLAWMEIYFARFPDQAIEKWILKFRPLVNRRVGGDATLLYGVPDLGIR